MKKWLQLQSRISHHSFIMSSRSKTQRPFTCDFVFFAKIFLDGMSCSLPRLLSLTRKRTQMNIFPPAGFPRNLPVKSQWIQPRIYFGSCSYPRFLENLVFNTKNEKKRLLNLYTFLHLQVIHLKQISN